MEEETPEVKKDSAEFAAFQETVKNTGAFARILEGKKLESWRVNKGATDHKVTNDNLVDFRPLTRAERRKVFHTPYKYGRRNGK